MFTRCLARLAKHVYNVLCKAFTPCLTWCLKRCSQGVSQCVPQGFYNVCCYKVCTRDLYNVFTRDLYRRLIQGTSTKCLQHFHKAFQPCVYNTSTGVFCNAPPRRLYILQSMYAICTSVFCKLFTNFVQVFLKSFYNTCTCDFERCSQQLYRCFLKGFYNTCTCVFERCLQRLCGVF